jgi:hypothetical protein
VEVIGHQTPGDDDDLVFQSESPEKAQEQRAISII